MMGDEPGRRPARTRRVLWAVVGLAAVGALAFAVATGGASTQRPGDRVERIASGIRCPTCQGLSAAESDAKAATAVRAEITRRVAEGQSDEQIRQALVDRYGREILLRPEGNGVAALVWARPTAAIVIASAALVVRLRRGAGSGASEGRSQPAVLRRTAVAAAVVVTAVGAGAAVARTAGERLPGESATGTVDLGPAELLIEARSRLADGEAVEALKLFDRVLEQDPAHPEALAYRGWLIRLAGQSAAGMDLVDSAIAADPEYPDARLFKGVMLLEDLQQPAAAVDELRRFLALAPESAFAAQARETLARAEAAASG